MPRRVRLIVFLGVIVMVILATGISAGAAPDNDVQSTQADIAAAQEHLAELRTDASIAQAKYDNALTKMNDLNTEMANAEDDLNAAEKRLSVAQDELEGSAAQVYKSGNVAFVDVLMGTDNFQDFATRLELWTRLLGQQQAEVETVREAKENLEDRKSELETQKARRVDAVEEALANKKEADQAQTEAEGYLDSLNGDLQAAIQAEQKRKAEAAAEKAAAQAAEAPDPQPAPQPVSQPDTDAKQAAAERAAAAQAAAEEAQRQADLAAQQAAKRDARQQAREEAQAAAEQAAVEAAAAEQARAEERAAERAAEQQAEQQAEREAARDAAADDRAAQRAAETASASASASADSKKDNKDASASASASADGKKGKDATATATSTATAGALKSGHGNKASGSGNAVVAEGERYIGTPYLLGGLPECVPFKTMDCSCFTMTVFSKFGISLPDSPGGQMGSGTPVDRSDVSAGDLLFWSEDGSGVITHVGIAVDNATTIHASVWDGYVVEGTSIDAIPGYAGAERLL